MALLPKIMLMAALLAPGLDPTAEEVRDLFEQASVQYETAEYKGAVTLFTEAYRRSASIQDEELRSLVQAALFFNLARAHSKSYRIDKEPEHLLQAEDLLNKYLSQTADLADKQKAEEFLEDTRRELARLEALAAEAERSSDTRGGGGRREDFDRSVGRGSLATGGTLISLGVLGGGAAIAGAVLASQATQEYADGPSREERDDARAKGDLGDQMILAGSITAGVLITSGIVFTAVGGAKRRRVRSTAWATPEGAGLTIMGRF
jgi:hypothetical protein